MSTDLNFVFSLLIVILLSTIALINSLYFVVLIIAALFGAYLDIFFFTPCKRSIAKDVANEENAISQITSVEGMELQVKSMEVKSYRYAYLDFAKRVVVGALIVSVSVALSIFEKSFALTNIVFYSCIGVLLYQNLTPLFGHDYRLEESLYSKARINNVVHQNDEKNSNNR